MRKEISDTLLKIYDRDTANDICKRFMKGERTQLLPPCKGVTILLVKGEYFIYATKDSLIKRGVDIKECLYSATFKEQLLNVKNQYEFLSYIFDRALMNIGDVDSEFKSRFLDLCYFNLFNITNGVQFIRDGYKIIIKDNTMCLDIDGEIVDLTRIYNIIDNTRYSLFENIFIIEIFNVIKDMSKSKSIAADFVYVLEDLYKDSKHREQSLYEVSE